MSDVFADGSTFLLRQGRLLERRLADTCLGGAPPSAVVDALRGYQNEDGGFGRRLASSNRRLTASGSSRHQSETVIAY